MTPPEAGGYFKLVCISIGMGTFVLDALVIRRAPDGMRLEWMRVPRYLRAMIPHAAKGFAKYFSFLVCVDMVFRLFGANSMSFRYSVLQNAEIIGGALLGGLAWQVLAACIAGSLYSSSSVSSCPGWRLHRCARWIFSPRTFTEILEPVLSDMHVEYIAALDEKRPVKAKWICLRGYLCFWSHVALQIPVDVVRVVVTLWRLGH